MPAGMFGNGSKPYPDPSMNAFMAPPYPAVGAQPSFAPPGGMASGFPTPPATPDAPSLMNSAQPQPGAASLTDSDPFPAMPTQSLLSSASLMPQGAIPHPRFFAKNGDWKTVASALSDAFLAYSAGAGNQGSAMLLQNSMQARRETAQRQRELADRQQQLQDQRTTWLQEQEYKRTHREPDEFDQSAIRAGIMPGTAEYAAASRTAFQNKTDPFRAIPYSGPEGEGLIFKRPSELGGSASPSPASGGARAPSPAAIAALAAHPEKASEFDAYYGAGASKHYANGGAAPGGAGSFPLYPARR